MSTMDPTERQRTLRRRIRDGEQMLADLDQDCERIMCGLVAAAEELEELLATHDFLTAAVAMLAPLSLEQWRALDLLERCSTALRGERTSIDAHLLGRDLNRRRHTEYSAGIAAMRAELGSIEGAPAGDERRITVN